MVAPLLAAGALTAGAGLAGSIFGRKKMPNYDVSGINRLINQGGEEQRRTIAQIRPETQAQLNQYQQGVQGAQAKADAARAAERAKYTAEIDPVTSRLLQSQTDQLKRSTFGAIPETQQAVREALASTGGLSRGIASEKLAGVPMEAARQFSEGATTLNQGALQEQQRVLANLHSEESQAIANNLGIDRDTYNTILSTGNQALINELNGLIEESRGRTGALVGAEQFRQSGNVANAAAENANRGAIFQALTNLGTTALGYGTGGVTPVPAPGATAAAPGVDTVESIVRRRRVGQNPLSLY